MTTTGRALASLVLAAALVIGCGRGSDRGPAEEGDASPEASSMEEGEMGGMEGTDDMARHMERMAGMGADSLMAEMPMHRQMVANMIARMNREMRDMGMAADADWNATVDSLRDDLIRMPDMSAAEMEARMPDHHRRVTRLMEMHRAMMAGMGM